MASNTYFTADFHIGHTNILKYCNRPFKTVNEMDQIIIDNFNAIVKNEDIVYFLGDLTFRQDMARRVLDSVHGKWHILWGNHDQWRSLNGHKRILSVSEFRPSIRIGSVRVTLCHYPMVSWQGSNHGSWQLHGHSHNNYNDPNKLQLDVGVDGHGFKPWSFDEIQVVMATKGKDKKFDPIDED